MIILKRSRYAKNRLQRFGKYTNTNVDNLRFNVISIRELNIYIVDKLLLK